MWSGLQVYEKKQANIYCRSPVKDFVELPENIWTEINEKKEI